MLIIFAYNLCKKSLKTNAKSSSTRKSFNVKELQSVGPSSVISELKKSIIVNVPLFVQQQRIIFFMISVINILVQKKLNKFKTVSHL